MLTKVTAVLTIVCACMASSTQAAPETYLTYTGAATVLGSNRFLYGERHTLHYVEGRLAERVVLYTCADGSAFARKRVSYVDGFAPDFELIDSRSGLREGMRSTATGRVVFYRDNGNEPERSRALAHGMDFIADAGFDEFVRAHWNELMAGQKIRVDFLVPSRLESFSFQLKHVRTEDSQSAEMFRLVLSGIWGWFLPGIDVYYGRSKHDLIRYDGLSNLRDATNGNYKVHITFAESARQIATAEAWAAANRASIARCR